MTGRFRYSVVALCMALPIAAQPTAALAEGEVFLFHRSAAESARAPRMAMWNYCADTLGITLIESFAPPDQYEVQLPVQLSSSNPPDVYAYWSGGRAQFQAATGKIRDLSDIWPDIKDNFPAGIQASSVEPDGKIYSVPTTFQPNVFWYNKRVFAENNLSEPKTFDELLVVAETLKQAGVTPFAVGAKAGWEPLLWFDYLLLRVAGSEFRNGLMSGAESYLDPRVIQAMELWADMIEKGYFLDGYSSMSWEEIAPKLMAGDVAMELMGSFTAGAFIRGGLVPDVDFGTFNFPSIDPAVEQAVEGAVEGWSASGAGANTENALEMLKCIATRDAQELFAAPAQRPVTNKDVPISVYEPPTIQPTMERFFDLLDAPFHQNLELATHPGVTEVAKREFGRFLVYPSEFMPVLEKLEQRRIEVFGD